MPHVKYIVRFLANQPIFLTRPPTVVANEFDSWLVCSREKARSCQLGWIGCPRPVAVNVHLSVVVDIE